MVDVGRGGVEELFHEVPLALQVYAALATLVDELGPASVRVTRSQVAFRRRTGFCWVWLPGMYLSHPSADVVVSLALPQEDRSPRWKERLLVGGRHWMHHLEVHGLDDLDDEVGAWVAEAYGAAG
jgi:hypothetical protein